jgi:hypothetical protein
MAGGGELRAFFEGAQEDTAEAVESAAGKMASFGDETAGNVRTSVSNLSDAEGANVDAITAISSQASDDATVGLPGNGPVDGETGTGTSRIADLLNGEGGSGHQATFGYTDSFDYKKTFFDENPDLEGEVVVHHAVEQQTLRRYPGTVTPNQMHSLENLRGIPKGEVNSRVHLSQLRKEWNRFYRDNPNPSKQDLLNEATRLDQKYGQEFNPPIK